MADVLNTYWSFQKVSDIEENPIDSITANHSFCTCKTTAMKSGLSTNPHFYSTIGTPATREFPLLSGKRSWH